MLKRKTQIYMKCIKQGHFLSRYFFPTLGIPHHIYCIQLSEKISNFQLIITWFLPCPSSDCAFVTDLIVFCSNGGKKKNEQHLLKDQRIKGKKKKVDNIIDGRGKQANKFGRRLLKLPVPSTTERSSLSLSLRKKITAY